ncbi:hypothetical protein G7Y79_00034g069320 [Physcia stellaris]|nr:hypothetical protein G7Y79_00034g069320 [Physcia stellaris]
MSDPFEPRLTEDPTSLINNLTLKLSLHAVAQHSAASESGVSGYYDFWSPLRTNLFSIRHQLQSNKVLTREDRGWLLAGLEIMKDELEFFTRLVGGIFRLGRPPLRT